MFKKGDRVRYIGSEKNYENECGVLNSLESILIGVETWIVRFNCPWLNDLEVKVDDIELILSKPEKYRYCECGAWAVKGFENMHSDWCRMYRSRK